VKGNLNKMIHQVYRQLEKEEKAKNLSDVVLIP
jgi:hypothetical protein